jgi:hypothetical protein
LARRQLKIVRRAEGGEDNLHPFAAGVGHRVLPAVESDRDIAPRGAIAGRNGGWSQQGSRNDCHYPDALHCSLHVCLLQTGSRAAGFPAGPGTPSPGLDFLRRAKRERRMIRKLKSGQYRLYSRKKDRKTGKRRNLGTFTSRAAAEKHERAVQYFKRG